MRLYHFTTAEHALSNIRLRRLKIATISELNDPFEFMSINMQDKAMRIGMREVKRLASQDYGILCFSKSWEHPMMWSHYADRHKGICLGFDVVGNQPVIEIEYRPQLLTAADFAVDTVDDLSRDHVMRSWFVKFNAWAYEKEMRMLIELDHDEAVNGLHFKTFAPDLKLAEVIVGYDCTKTRADIAEALAGLPDVKAIKARLAFQSFRVRENEEPSMWR